MALQFKRGTNATRLTLVLEAGEPFFVTDASTYGVSPFWIGNGSTAGGVAATEVSNIDELLDVAVNAPSNNQLLQYVSANGRWENKSNITIPGTLTSSGLATMSNGLTVTGQTSTTTLVTTGNATVGGDAIITGNLTVQGTTTTVNSETVNIADNIITLNSNVTGSPTENAGIEIERGDLANVAIRWNETDDSWELTHNGTTYNRLPNQNTSIGSNVTFGTITASGLNIGTLTGDVQTSVIKSLTGNTAMTIANTGVVTIPTNNLAFTGNNGITGYPTGTNDYWLINGGSTGSDAGYLQITTGDNGTEPIYVRQMNGASVSNELILLDASGNTTIPQNIFMGSGKNILWSESDNRANRLNFQSYTGASTGIRVKPPGTTNSEIATISVNSSSDIDNGKFLNINARGSSFSDDLRIQSGKYTAGVLGASGSSIAFIDNTTTYARVNPSGPTNSLDLTTKSYVDAKVPQPIGTTDFVQFSGVNLDDRAVIDTVTATTTSTAEFSLDSTTRNAIKLMVYMQRGTDSHLVEILIMRTSTSAMMTLYGEMYTGSALATFTADQSGGLIRVRATPTSATSTTFSAQRIALT